MLLTLLSHSIMSSAFVCSVMPSFRKQTQEAEGPKGVYLLYEKA